MIAAKKKLIAEIEKINDNDILEQLTRLISESDQSVVFEFSYDQISNIKESQDQIENSDFVDHQNVMDLIDND